MGLMTAATEAKACADAGWICWVEGHPGLSQLGGTVVALLAAGVAPWIALWFRRVTRTDEQQRIARHIASVMDVLAFELGKLSREIESDVLLADVNIESYRDEIVAAKRRIEEVREAARELANRRLFQIVRGSLMVASWVILRLEQALRATHGTQERDLSFSDLERNVGVIATDRMKLIRFADGPEKHLVPGAVRQWWRSITRPHWDR